MNRKAMETAILRRLRHGEPVDVIDLWDTLKDKPKANEIVFAIALAGLEEAGFVERRSLNVGIYVRRVPRLN